MCVCFLCILVCSFLNFMYAFVVLCVHVLPLIIHSILMYGSLEGTLAQEAPLSK